MSEETNDTTQENPNRNPYTLWFVILSFFLPVAAAYYMFFFGDITSFSNNGEFVNPYYEINLLELKQDGEDFNAESLNNKWHMLMVAGGSCDDVCQQHMINFRQIAKSIKRPPKLRHAIAFSSMPDVAFEAFLQAEMPHTIRLQADADKIADRILQDGSVSQIYLSDPLGNIIMRFPHELTPKLVIKDLNRLF